MPKPRNLRETIMPRKDRRNDDTILKYIYTIPKHTIWACQTVHFSLPNGPFRVLKRTVSQRQMACIGNLLEINILQRRGKVRHVMNYFYILLQVFCIALRPPYCAHNHIRCLQ